METKDQQIKHVVAGVALGTLANNVVAVTSAKMTFEFAFTHAWNRWSRASKFPSIAGHDPGNMFWIGVGRSLRRTAVSAAWEQDKWSRPVITLGDWIVGECLDLHADERASADDWIELGRLFVAEFNPDQMIRAGSAPNTSTVVD